MFADLLIMIIIKYSYLIRNQFTRNKIFLTIDIAFINTFKLDFFFFFNFQFKMFTNIVANGAAVQ